MTLPTDIILPLDLELVKAGDIESLTQYNKNLIDVLTDMYQSIAQNVNGAMRQWTPVIYGSTDEGEGTYTRQTGWLRRAGTLTELWFDVAWTDHDGTGNLYIQVPYKALNSEDSPWVGVCAAMTPLPFNSGYSYLAWRVEPNTIEGRIIQCGSNKSGIALPIQTSGGIAGYISYIGQEFEN